MKQSGRDVAKAYQRYLKLERNFTANTVDAYMRDLQKLVDYLRAEGIDPVEVKLEDLQHFALVFHRAPNAAS